MKPFIFRVPGLLTYRRSGDLAHLQILGRCIYVRAGRRRRLMGIVWGGN